MIAVSRSRSSALSSFSTMSEDGSLSSLQNDKRPFQENFESYVEKTRKYSKVGFEEALAFVREGALLRQQIQKGSLVHCTLEEKRRLIVPFTWFLMFKAIEKREGFLQGMFVVEDPGHKIASFFKEVGYERISSHYHGRSGQNYGIDMPKKLPYGFRTVLFGELSVSEKDGDWTFWKPENHGLGSSYDKVMHALSYVADLALRVIRPSQGEYNRKENLPLCFKKVGKQMRSVGMNIQKDTVAEWGISGLFKAAISCLQKNPSHQQEVVSRRFVQQARASYDWLHIRSGNEVVISEREDPFLYEEV